MIFKIIILLCIVITSTLIGFQYSSSLKIRIKQLESILNSVIYLENEIFYRLMPLTEALRAVAEKQEKLISDFLNDIADNLQDTGIDSTRMAFNNAVIKNKMKLELKDEDYDILLELSNSIGSTDLEGQMKIFELAINNLKSDLKRSSEKTEKSVKMYKVLGISIGLIIAIFLI